MGMLGRWIDDLDDDARDRIVRAQDWCAGWLDTTTGQRCLVGHAAVHFTLIEGRRERAFGSERDWQAALQFDALVRRFGLARVVRACKLAAGADLPDMGAVVPEPDPTRAEA